MDFLDWILDPKTVGKVERIIKLMNNDTSNQMCVAPGLSHNIEFVVAAFGQTCFKCTLCGEYFDEYDDGLAG